MKWITSLSFIFILVVIKTNAQTNFSIHGVVSDSARKTVNDGFALLYNQSDSIQVKYAVVSKGVFDLKEVKQGGYILKISCPGYADKLRMITLTGNVSIEFNLGNKLNSLDEVQIVGTKKMYSYKGGNIKVNVENTLLSSIPDPVDLLSKLPGVQVSPDRESLSILGKGEPLIYMDNQRISMSDLISLSVNDIKSIEIINNPSSKYEANGRAVILITRKSNTREGEKIDVSETASMKHGFQNRAGVNASMKRKKLELKCNLNYNYQERWEGIGTHIFQPINNSEFNSEGTSTGPRSQYLFGLGVYRQLNEGDYFSVNANARIQKEPYIIDTHSSYRDPSVYTNVLTHSTNMSDRPFMNLNFNYAKKLKKINSQLFAGGQVSHYERNVINHIFNDYDNTQLLLTEDRQQNYEVDVAVARIDFEKNFKNKMKWESGASMTMAKASSYFAITGFSPAVNSATYYNYLENNQALYTQLSGNIKRIAYSVGVRMENTFLQGGFKDSSSLLLDKKFTQFFPKANLEIPLDSFKTLTLNYARSIRRPDYSTANQIINYISPFFEFSNNINLVPSISDEISANWDASQP